MECKGSWWLDLGILIVISYRREGGKYHVYAGKECARALGMMSTKAEDCNDNLKDLPGFHLEDVKERLKEFESKYPVYGKVIAQH